METTIDTTENMTVATSAPKKLKADEYIYTIGRRKNATAQVRLYEAKDTEVTVNERTLEDYFPTQEMRKVVTDPFGIAKLGTKYKVTVVVRGGGIHAQAEAVRHGITRGLVKIDETLRKALKDEGFLKRDPRSKERKKPGLKKARKASQWSKR